MLAKMYQQDKIVQKELFGSENGGFAGPINYYKAALHGLSTEDDQGKKKFKINSTRKILKKLHSYPKRKPYPTKANTLDHLRQLHH